MVNQIPPAAATATPGTNVGDSNQALEIPEVRKKVQVFTVLNLGIYAAELRDAVLHENILIYHDF